MEHAAAGSPLHNHHHLGEALATLNLEGFTATDLNRHLAAAQPMSASDEHLHSTMMESSTMPTAGGHRGLEEVEEEGQAGSPVEEGEGGGRGEEEEESSEDVGSGTERDQRRRRRTAADGRGTGRRTRVGGPGYSYMSPTMGGYEAVTRLLIPGGRIGGVIGRGGDVIKSIREMTGARVSIASSGADDRDSHFRLVTASGSISAVCSAVDMIAQQANLYESSPTKRPPHAAAADDAASTGSSYEPGLRMIIDAASAGKLIGKKGSIINDIRAKSGAKIIVISEDDSLQEGGLPEERVVLVIGESMSCRRAHQLICSALAADSQTVSHMAKAAAMVAPAALGDPTLRQQPGGGFLPSAASSMAMQARHMSLAAASLQEESDEPEVQVTMRIPNDKIGRVIGKEGTTINKIRQESGCRIDIENHRAGDNAMRTIRMRGNLQQTQMAQQLISQRMSG